MLVHPWIQVLIRGNLVVQRAQSTVCILRCYVHSFAMFTTHFHYKCRVRPLCYIYTVIFIYKIFIEYGDCVLQVSMIPVCCVLFVLCEALSSSTWKSNRTHICSVHTNSCDAAFSYSMTEPRWCVHCAS